MTIKGAHRLAILLAPAVTAAACSGSQVPVRPPARSSGDEPPIAWVRAHAVPVRSIDPGDHDFADLAPLVPVIGGARVVLLSEQKHVDGATFAARARLTRFLHEVMGFDVLAFESGLWDCERMNAALYADTPIADAMTLGLFSNAAKSGHHRRVFEYARETYATSHPLEFAGFDPQFSGASHGADYPAWLLSFFDRASPDLVSAAQRAALARAFTRFPKLSYFRALTAEERRADRKVFEELRDLVDARRNRLLAVHTDDAIDVCRRTLEDVLVLYDWHAALKIEEVAPESDGRVLIGAVAQHLGKHYDELVNVRDAAMAANVMWLLDRRYRGRKMVIWAHAGHAIYSPDSITAVGNEFDYEGFHPMGEHLASALGHDLYGIGFVAYDGAAGIGADAKPIPVPEPGSLEQLFAETGAPYLFVDFKPVRDNPSHWLHRGIVAGPISYVRARADWSRVFDGMFFTRTMFPADAEGSVPTNAPVPGR